MTGNKLSGGNFKAAGDIKQVFSESRSQQSVSWSLAAAWRSLFIAAEAQIESERLPIVSGWIPALFGILVNLSKLNQKMMRSPNT